MMKVGDFVQYTKIDVRYFGIISKIIIDPYSNICIVDFTHPKPQTLYTYEKDLTKLTEEEYWDLTHPSDNPIIKHAQGCTKSIDQMAEDFMELEDEFSGSFEDYMDMVAWNESFGIPYNESSRSVKSVTKMPNGDYVPYSAELTAEWKKALKEAYIDMALATKDFEWLAKLTKESE